MLRCPIIVGLMVRKSAPRWRRIPKIRNIYILNTGGGNLTVIGHLLLFYLLSDHPSTIPILELQKGNQTILMQSNGGPREQFFTTPIFIIMHVVYFVVCVIGIMITATTLDPIH